MNIDKATLHKMAHLSRLEIQQQDEERLVNEMSNMVTFVEKLNELDTDGVEPLTSMSHEVNALREDEVKGHLDHDQALGSAPRKDDTYFRVPKVLE